MGDLGTVTKGGEAHTGQQNRILFDTSNGGDGWQGILRKNKLCLAYNWVIFYIMTPNGILEPDSECRIKLQLKIPQQVRKRIADFWIALVLKKMKSTPYPIFLQLNNHCIDIEAATVDKIKPMQVFELRFNSKQEESVLHFMDTILPPDDIELDHLIIFSQLEELIKKAETKKINEQDLRWLRVLKALFGLDKPVLVLDGESYEDSETNEDDTIEVREEAPLREEQLSEEASIPLKEPEETSVSESSERITQSTTDKIGNSSNQKFSENFKIPEAFQGSIAPNTQTEESAEVVIGTEGNSQVIYRRITTEEFVIPNKVLERDPETTQAVQAALVEVNTRFKACLRNFIQAPSDVTARILNNADCKDNDKEVVAPATTPGARGRLEVAMAAFREISKS